MNRRAVRGVLIVAAALTVWAVYVTWRIFPASTRSML